MSLILLERTSRWAAAFRREMRKAEKRRQPIPIQEVRSPAQCQRELEAAPHSVVALEILPQNLVSMAKAVGAWSRHFPSARFLALTARGMEPHELLLREAGAMHVTFSPRSLSPLLRLVRRHLARAPQPERTLEEAIWAGLPWG
jgi:DNA-binding response OmpR family regulator